MTKSVNFKKLTPSERKAIAKKLRVSPGSLDHIASGMRQPSAYMARRIEEATIALGLAPVTRESLCKACGGCELAKIARKVQKDEGVIW